MLGANQFVASFASSLADRSWQLAVQFVRRTLGRRPLSPGTSLFTRQLTHDVQTKKRMPEVAENAEEAGHVKSVVLDDLWQVVKTCWT